MNCQILFSGKNNKNGIILSSDELAKRVEKVIKHISRGTAISTCTRQDRMSDKHLLRSE